MDTSIPEASESECAQRDQQSLAVLLKRLGLSEDAKLTTMDGSIFNANLEKDKLQSTDIVPCFFQDISAKDQKALRNLHENYKKTGNGDIVSGRDLMFAILTCCDDFLRQDVLRKLVRCKIAVPALLTDVRTSQVTFLLWGLRQCNELRYDPKTKTYEEINLTKYRFMTVSAFRFGEVTMSKSNILNNLLKSLHGFDVNDSFMSQTFDAGSRVCSLGTVECMPYVPSNKSATTHPINLLNLRGDALKYKEQLEFCCKNSQIIIVLSQSLQNESVEQNLRSINPSANVIFVLPENKKGDECKGERNSVIIFEDQLQKVLEKITCLIENVFTSDASSFQSFDKLSCTDLNIRVDEHFVKCKKAKSDAMRLSTDIKISDYDDKYGLFPLQSIIDTRSILMEGNPGKDAVEANQIDSQRIELRRRQNKLSLSAVMERFVSIAFDSDKEFVNYFLTWFQIFLKEGRFKMFKPVTLRTKKLMFSKSHETDNCPSNYDAAVIDQDAFIREIGQMFESKRSVHFATGKQIETNEMAKFAFDLLINGHCIELFQNETAWATCGWIKAVFECLHTALRNKPTVRVASVIGGPSSGKSHLLNCTFGTKFTEGDRKCSRGVHLALVPLHSNTKKLVKCDFLIIFDTQGVNVSEKTVPDSLKRNNYVSTLVSCISDVVIIKLGKEDTPQEITDVFNITLRGLQVSRDVGKVVKACIVQSFYNTHKEPILIDLEKKLADATEEGTSTEHKQLQKKKFSSELLECFSVEKGGTQGSRHTQLLFTPDTHCSLKDSERHSSDIQAFRATVMQMLKECSKSPRFFTEFGEHVVDVIQSMGSHDFIQAFQAATLRRRCDVFISQCEQTLSTVQTKLAARITQVSDTLITAFNHGKSMEEVGSIGQRETKQLSELAIGDLHNLLRKIDTESKQDYFQLFLSSIEAIKTKVELFLSNQLSQIDKEVKNTITDIKRYGDLVTNFNKKLTESITNLEKQFTISCDKLCTTEHDKIDSFVKKCTKNLTTLLDNEFQVLSDKLNAIDYRKFETHFESVEEHFKDVSSKYRVKISDVLRKRADEVNEMFACLDKIETQLNDIQTEVTKKLSAMVKELENDNSNENDSLTQKTKSIETYVTSEFGKIQTHIQDKIDKNLFPHVHESLTEKSTLAKKICIQESQKSLTVAADRVKETKALQECTKSLQRKKRDKYVLQFNIVLKSIQQELEGKLMSLCREIMGAKLESITEVSHLKEKEFRNAAQEQVKALLDSTSEETGKSFEKKEHKSFETSSKSMEKHLLSKMAKQFKETIEKAKKKKEHDAKVRAETKNFLNKVTEECQNLNEVSKTSINETFGATFKPYLSKLKENYPLPPISKLKKLKRTLLLSKLSQNVSPNEGELSHNTDTFNDVRSKADVAKMSKEFCGVNERNVKDFNHLTSLLQDLSDDFKNFEQNTLKSVNMVKRFVTDFKLIHRVSLFSVVCSKFISNTHKNHVNAELKHTHTPHRKMEMQSKRLKEQNGKQSVQTRFKIITDVFEIKDVEPLKFPTLDSKVKHFREVLVNLNEEEIAKTLSNTTVKNYSNLPLTIETVRRVDNCFMRLLPPLKAEDMQHLHQTVNDAKLAIIGKTMAKVSYDFQNYLSDITDAAENSHLGSARNEQVSTATLTHLSAWSANLMAVKELEEARDTNIATVVEQNQTAWVINLYKQYDQSCDELIAEEICRQIENSLEDCIEEKFLTTLTTEMSKRYYNKIGLKRRFIGMILQSSFGKKDHKEYIHFVNNFNKLCDKWTLNFLASDCNKESGSFIEEINESLIKSTIEAAIVAVNDTTSAFEHNADRKIATWLSLFESSFIQKNETLLVIENDVLDTEGRINDHVHFARECINRLESLKEKVKSKREMPEKGNLDSTRTWLLSLPNNIHVEMSNFIKGCTEQCPFCGHPCDQDLCEHDLHETSIHIPRGLKGSKNTATNLLTPAICTTAVKKGTGKFKVKDIEGVWKDYKKQFPKWQISGDETDCIPFWKHIFVQFNLQFSEYHECHAGFIENWSAVNEDVAQISLNETYLNVES